MKRPRLQPLLFGQELCRRELAPRGVPTMEPRVLRLISKHALSLTTIASELAPTGLSGVRSICGYPKNIVGASLLAMRPAHSTSVSPDRPPSRASPLPQFYRIMAGPGGVSGGVSGSSGIVDQVAGGGIFAARRTIRLRQRRHSGKLRRPDHGQHLFDQVCAPCRPSGAGRGPLPGRADPR